MSTLVIRNLSKSDFDKGYLNIINNVSKVGNITKEMFERRFDENKEQHGYYHVVGEENGRLVGAATLFIERKFARQCGKAGHIEDVATDPSVRGLGFGKKIIEHLIEKAREEGCYKVILDCSEENVEFYKKCGLSRGGCEMKTYL